MCVCVCVRARTIALAQGAVTRLAMAGMSYQWELVDGVWVLKCET